MSQSDQDEILSPAQVAQLLAENTAEQVGQVTLALLYITSQLRKQPNFDAAAFDARMLEGAHSKTDPKDKLLRTILLAAGGKDIEEILDKP